MFEESLNLFLAYRQRCFAKDIILSGYDVEIGHKIMQLNWLISRSQILNDKVIKAMNSDKHATEELCELEILTESFYYFVGRLTELFKKNNNFGNLPRSGAEKVRHQLLQHPENEGDREKSYPSFECGGLNGPVVKGYSAPEGAYQDKGLFANAREFNAKLVLVFANEAK